MTALIAGVWGVALGGIPFAWLVHRVATGRDLRREGSGNPGAANVQRSAGTGWGLVALALDAGKAAFAVATARAVGGAGAGIAAAAGAVAGHVFSPWLSGRGGKGVAAAAGAFGILAPIPTAAATAAFALLALATRWISLASVGAGVVLPFAAAATGASGGVIAAAAGTAILIAWRHRENFARMRRGTEPRVSWRARDRENGGS